MGMQFVLVSLEFIYDDILLIRLWIEETRGGDDSPTMVYLGGDC